MEKVTLGHRSWNSSRSSGKMVAQMDSMDQMLRTPVISLVSATEERAQETSFMMDTAC